MQLYNTNITFCYYIWTFISKRISNNYIYHRNNCRWFLITCNLSRSRFKRNMNITAFEGEKTTHFFDTYLWQSLQCICQKWERHLYYKMENFFRKTILKIYLKSKYNNLNSWLYLFKNSAQSASMWNLYIAMNASYCTLKILAIILVSSWSRPCNVGAKDGPILGPFQRDIFIIHLSIKINILW